ncbi:MAG: HAD family hydrolase [Clostridia bacterium]|nr:HAD family hydrolase [Clostridia bacterium]
MEKNIFKGYLILSDLDGTLIPESRDIPKRNIDAIERFKKLGGKFSLATGRNKFSVSKYNESLKFNAPAIILNGGAIYDFENDEFISELFVNKTNAAAYMKKILEKFPSVGVEIYVDGAINIIKENEYVQYHMNMENNNYVYCNLEDIKSPWYKVFFAVDEKIMNQVKEYAQSITGEDVIWVTSCGNFLEMLPSNSNKGNAFNRLIGHLKIDNSKACAIGDYYNDWDLLKAAGICAAPENAPEDIKSFADVVVSHCDKGAVADFIEYLEKNIER